MNESRKAIIIGAGVGGLATAVFLAQKGFTVEVYEKNANPGGRCGQMIQDGHRFDLGVTILLMPSIYRKVFERIDIENGTFSAEELNPTAEEIKERVWKTIEEFKSEQRTNIFIKK